MEVINKELHSMTDEKVPIVQIKINRIKMQIPEGACTVDLSGCINAEYSFLGGGGCC